MRRVCFVLTVLLALVGSLSSATAQSGSDRQADGDFVGIAMITDDLRWHELFQRPEAPRINGQDRFGPGDRGALAIIFSNAEPRNGAVRIECDITAFDPDGSYTVVDSGICYEGPYYGDGILHPALLDLQFEIGEDDPPGRAGFEVTLRDANSRRDVDLAVAFTQGE